MAYPNDYDTKTACANGLHYFDSSRTCVHCGHHLPEPFEAALSEEDFPLNDDGMAI